MNATILSTADRDEMIAVLREARKFVAFELACRRGSYRRDEPENAEYVVPVETLLAKLDAILARVGAPT